MAYNPDAVNKAIASSNRSVRKIGGNEAKSIHRLLGGRGLGSQRDEREHGATPMKMEVQTSNSDREHDFHHQKCTCPKCGR